MKATLDIPDNLYRRVKARSALEGRSLRAIAIELFRNWLQAPANPLPPETSDPTPEELAKFPWLDISRKYVKPGVSHEMEDIRESIARGWVAESAERLTRKPVHP